MKKAYARLGIYYGKHLSDMQIEMYAEDLMALSLEEAKQAVQKWRSENPKFFPMPGDLIAMIKPQLDPRKEAATIATQIIEASASIGRYNKEEAKRVLGPKAWLVASKFGWDRICDNPIDQNGVLLAQLRDFAESVRTINNMSDEQKRDLEPHAKNLLINGVENDMENRTGIESRVIDFNRDYLR